MAKTENILRVMEERKKATGVPMTLFAACPNSLSVIKASFRAAKRNNSPIYFEAAAVHYTGPYVVAIDHGGPWLKDKQSIERWDTERAMDGVKKSYEAAILAGYDLIHVDPTVDIFLPKGEIIDIHVVVKRTVELILHAENFRKAHGIAPISYEVGTEEVHGGLADEKTFDTFLEGLKQGLRSAQTDGKGSSLRQLYQGSLHRRCGQSGGLSEGRHGRCERWSGVHDERVRGAG